MKMCNMCTLVKELCMCMHSKFDYLINSTLLKLCIRLGQCIVSVPLAHLQTAFHCHTLSHDVASGSAMTPCIKIAKPLVV